MFEIATSICSFFTLSAVAIIRLDIASGVLPVRDHKCQHAVDTKMSQSLVSLAWYNPACRFGRWKRPHLYDKFSLDRFCQ